jgi:hypothetical protein
VTDPRLTQADSDVARLCRGCKKATKKRRNAKDWMECAQGCGYVLCPACGDLDEPQEALGEHELKCTAGDASDESE